MRWNYDRLTSLFFERERERERVRQREAIPLRISHLYNILCTVNTQNTSRQDAIITIRLWLATCFGRDRPSSGQLRTTIKVHAMKLRQTDKPFFWERERVRQREAIPLRISHLYNILCTVNTQYTSRQDAVITVRLYLATCFGRDRPSSGQLKKTIKVQ